MAPSEILEGTWDELALHARELSGMRLRLTIIKVEDPCYKSGVLPPPQNLAEYLAEYIGSVEGSGENNSEDTGAKFADHLASKHEEGCL